MKALPHSVEKRGGTRLTSHAHRTVPHAYENKGPPWQDEGRINSDMLRTKAKSQLSEHDIKIETTPCANVNLWKIQSLLHGKVVKVKMESFVSN